MANRRRKSGSSRHRPTTPLPSGRSRRLAPLSGGWRFFSFGAENFWVVGVSFCQDVEAPKAGGLQLASSASGPAGETASIWALSTEPLALG